MINSNISKNNERRSFKIVLYLVAVSAALFILHKINISDFKYLAESFNIKGLADAFSKSAAQVNSISEMYQILGIILFVVGITFEICLFSLFIYFLIKATGKIFAQSKKSHQVVKNNSVEIKEDILKLQSKLLC